MSDLPEAGAQLTLDLSEWNASWDSVMGDAAELQSTIDDLSGSVDVDINVTGDDTLPFDEIPDSTETEVDVTEGPDNEQVISDVHFLASMEKLETVWNIIGTGVDFITSVGGKILNPFLDVDAAVGRINAQTGSGTGIDDLGQFIRDIQGMDLGTGVDQIANVITRATQLKLPVEEATKAALTFTHTWTDQDAATVVGAWGTALQTGIVDNMQEASDLMTIFFQQGGNIGGDAVQVVQANAQSWSDMGLSMAEALSLMNSLQTGTGATATDAAKMMQTFDDALTAAAADPASQQAKLLTMIGVDNPKEQGAAIGADTFNAFAEAFSSASSENQDLISGLFFGKGGKKFTGAISEMTSQGDPFKDVKDAAADAATEIDNSLRGAIADFVTEMNKVIADLLSSDKIDLPGKIAAIKEAIQRGIAEIQSGGTLGEGLEVALSIPGLSKSLDTFIGNFERIIGNLEIAFLQVVAAVQDLTGHGKEADATRQTIFDRSMGQLQFDLQLANPDEVDTMIQQAMGRGLNATNVGAALNTAINETIANANFDQGSKIIEGLLKIDPTAFAPFATDFVTKLSGGFDNAMSAGNLDLMQKLLAIDPNAKIPGLDEAVKGFQKQLSDAFTPQNRAGDTGGNPFLSGIGAGAGLAAGSAGSSPDMFGFGAVVDTLKTKAGEAQTTVETAATGMGNSFANLQTVTTPAMDAVIAKVGEVGTAAQTMDTNVATAFTDNTVTASFLAVQTAADSAFPGVMAWFAKTGAAAAAFDNIVSLHLRSVSKQLADLNFLAQQVIANVTSAQALGGSGVGAGGGTTNNVTNNVSVTNNVPSSAAAAANGYAVGASLRPGGT